MAAPRGNQFWKARTKHGRNKLFASSAALWEACQEYFQWVEDHPLKEEKLFAFQGSVTRVDTDKMFAMTISSLCIFLDVDVATWFRWRSDDDFCKVAARVDAIIRQQKFAGAAAELLNPQIIARDLGLSEKVDNTHAGPEGGPVQITSIEIVAPDLPVKKRD